MAEKCQVKCAETTASSNQSAYTRERLCRQPWAARMSSLATLIAFFSQRRREPKAYCRRGLCRRRASLLELGWIGRLESDGCDESLPGEVLASSGAGCRRFKVGRRASLSSLSAIARRSCTCVVESLMRRLDPLNSDVLTIYSSRSKTRDQRQREARRSGVCGCVAKTLAKSQLLLILGDSFSNIVAIAFGHNRRVKILNAQFIGFLFRAAAKLLKEARSPSRSILKDQTGMPTRKIDRRWHPSCSRLALV